MGILMSDCRNAASNKAKLAGTNLHMIRGFETASVSSLEGDVGRHYITLAANQFFWFNTRPQLVCLCNLVYNERW
jgi:hypothetical protein